MGPPASARRGAAPAHPQRRERRQCLGAAQRAGAVQAQAGQAAGGRDVARDAVVGAHQVHGELLQATRLGQQRHRGSAAVGGHGAQAAQVRAQQLRHRHPQQDELARRGDGAEGEMGRDEERSTGCTKRAVKHRAAAHKRRAGAKARQPSRRRRGLQLHGCCTSRAGHTWVLSSSPGRSAWSVSSSICATRGTSHVRNARRCAAHGKRGRGRGDAAGVGSVAHAGRSCLG